MPGGRGSEPGEPLGGDRLDPLSVRAGVDQEQRGVAAEPVPVRVVLPGGEVVAGGCLEQLGTHPRSAGVRVWLRRSGSELGHRGGPVLAPIYPRSTE